MVDLLSMLHKQRIIFKWENYCHYWGVSGLTMENEESQYQVLAGKILQSDIDLVIDWGGNVILLKTFV